MTLPDLRWATAWAALCALLLCPSALAATLYVWQDSPSPTPPYATWATAARTIQDAVDAASAGGEIVVTNGVYGTGARAVYGMSNRVAVTKPVTVRSVNGPAVTHIVGYQVPGTTNGPAAVRCVYLTNGAVLMGFTLTNGATQSSGDASTNCSGGGVWCEGATAVVSNCVLTGNTASGSGGGAYRGTLYNCILTGNSAPWSSGGGAYYSTLTNCTLTGNSASYGGGAYGGTLQHCRLTGNSAGYGGGASGAALQNCTLTDNLGWLGGGASGGRLYNCTLAGNWSHEEGGGAWGATLHNCTLAGNGSEWHGGGACQSTLDSCTLTGNWAYNYGGGAYDSTLHNSSLTGNSAHRGGGAYRGTLHNCTLIGNSADVEGGGAYGSTLRNCVIYYNRTRYRSANYSGDCTFTYCCTRPLPPGPGNIDTEPELASSSHLSLSSPCRGRGSAAYASGLDIDGEPWADPPSMGCDEYWSGSLTGALSVAIVAACTNVAVGFAVEFQALIDGRVSASRWDFGDGVVVSNRPYASHAWAAPGDYVVELRAYNETYPDGVAATVMVHVSQEEHYVALDSANPVPPYSSWATAARNIQDAVDVAILPGAVVWVSNGVYQTGARVVYGMSNRVAVTKPVMVRSVNGPTVTYIVGAGPRGPRAVRCVYLTNGAVLAGFTLTNGATQGTGDTFTNRSGGGVWCEGPTAVVSNCVLRGNSAYNYGGGALSGTLHNCVLISNWASSGGGASGGSLRNCTLVANSASYGGGASDSTLENCIVYYNRAGYGGTNYYGGALNYCCTTPLPEGPGNLTNAPLFLDTNGWSNLRLQPNSPCINQGDNTYAAGDTDLDGNPRIAGGRVDIGAYEFQGEGLSGFGAWLWQYGLATDGSADTVDSDQDGLSNWQEWQADTNPTNALSVLRIQSISAGPPVTVRFPSSTNRLYTLWFATNLVGASWAEVPGQTDVPGWGGLQALHDTNAVPPRFYRVGARRP